jgi:hypothetical protein
MFKNSSLNKKDSVTETISYIKTLKPMDAMKEANSVIGRKGKYKNLTPEESKKILTDTEDHIFERDIPIDPEDMARGGRAGYAVGNQVTPQVDARMNLDYDTLVNQNQAQAATQAQNRGIFSGPAFDKYSAERTRAYTQSPSRLQYNLDSNKAAGQFIQDKTTELLGDNPISRTIGGLGSFAAVPLAAAITPFHEAAQVVAEGRMKPGSGIIIPGFTKLKNKADVQDTTQVVWLTLNQTYLTSVTAQMH